LQQGFSTTADRPSNKNELEEIKIRPFADEFQDGEENLRDSSDSSFCSADIHTQEVPDEHTLPTQRASGGMNFESGSNF
jgi:hypothetical protein